MVRLAEGKSLYREEREEKNAKFAKNNGEVRRRADALFFAIFTAFLGDLSG